MDFSHEPRGESDLSVDVVVDPDGLNVAGNVIHRNNDLEWNPEDDDDDYYYTSNSLRSLTPPIEPGAYYVCEGATPLHSAAETGTEDACKLLLDEGADVHAEDESGLTPLHVAVRERHGRVVEILLEKGADVDRRSENGATSLHFAVSKEISEIRRTLLEGIGGGGEAAVLEKDQGGLAPLHLAAQSSCMAIASMLVEHAAHIDARCENGATALHFAAQEGTEELCRLLLKRGADANAKDFAGLTPLHLAAHNAHDHIVEILLEHGADVHLNAGGGRTRPYFDADSESAEEICRLLLKRGADANARDKNGATPLHLAVREKRVGVVGILLEHDAAGVHSRTETGGATPLHIAVQGGREEICAMLLKKGSDPNAKDNAELTPLHLAVRARDERVVRMLLKHGADVNVKTVDGETLLQFAMHCGTIDVHRLLLDAGADIDAKDDAGSTALHTAARHARVDVAELLLQSGADINSVDDEGNTALHLAAKTKYNGVLLILVESGCDVTVVNESNETAFQVNYSKHRSDGNFTTVQRLLIKMQIAAISCKRRLDDDFVVTEDASPEDSEFVIECEEEIRRMKDRKIDNTNATFHDVLTKRTINVVPYTRNDDVVRVFELADYQREFPEYGQMLKVRYEKGVARKQLLDEGYKFFRACSDTYYDLLPHNCIERIMNNLSDKWLMSLKAKSVRPPTRVVEVMTRRKTL